MSNEKKYNVAVVGATGAVGQKMLETLEKKKFPIDTLKLLSSKRSAGTKLSYNEKIYTVEEATPESFEGIDIALFSAGGSVSEKLAPEAVKKGAVVIDNTSAFRMTANVPLVVPEVNEADIQTHQGIIANPNCSTIQMVAALQPLKKQFGIKRIIVSTYQAVSGAGNEALEELTNQSKSFLDGEDMKAEILPVGSAEKHYPIAFNALPQIDVFTENGFTFEEMKMINETKKIFHDDAIEVAATCVRLPVFTSHAESVYVELDGTPSVDEVRTLLADADGVTLQDQPEEQIYPTPLASAGLPDVFVGRIRKDLDRDNGYHMWIVSDNLLKGAAWNSVQIAESIIKNNWL